MRQFIFYIKVIFFLCCFHICYSQVVILDKENLLPIPFVELYSDSGVFLGSSNAKGEINNRLHTLIKSYKTNQVHLSHISYKPRVLSKDSFQLVKRVILVPNVVVLKDVSIISSKSKNSYVKISAYFRGYQTYDEKIKYFVDGIVSYYLHSSKRKKSREITDAYRAFVNIALFPSEGKFRKVTVGVSEPGVPYLNKSKKTLLKKVLERDSTTIVPFGDMRELIIKEKQKDIGKIVFDTLHSLAIVNAELISEDNPKINKIFGNEVTFTNVYSSEYYEGTELSDIQYNNLKYNKSISIAKYKSKKAKQYAIVKNISELFVINVEYTNNIHKTKISEYDFFKESNYSYPFWEDVKSDLYQPLPKSVEKALETTLTELENAHTETK